MFDIRNYLDIPFREINSLAHHGILGQKWGIRRFQNRDGSLTAEGAKRYGREESSFNERDSGDRSYETKRYERKAGPSERRGAGDYTENDMKAAVKKMLGNCKTGEEADEKEYIWEQAADLDKYHIDFVEAIQNSEIMDQDDRNGLLTEYAKFLDHPDEYMKNEARKLREV